MRKEQEAEEDWEGTVSCCHSGTLKWAHLLRRHMTGAGEVERLMFERHGLETASKALKAEDNQCGGDYLKSR